MKIRALANRFKNGRTLGAVITLSLTLILITPLCGYLFQCGCAWPWNGLDAACNIHDLTATHQCPWCASPLAGWLSTAASIAAGLAATASRGKFGASKLNETVGRCLLGVIAFGIVAWIAATLSSKMQHYPYGVLGVNNPAGAPTTIPAPKANEATKPAVASI